MKKIKWWFAAISVPSYLMAIGHTEPIVGLLYLSIIGYPLLGVIRRIWKLTRFLGIPTPRQLWKGYSLLWPEIEKGPVVKRISKPRSSPTP